MRSDDSINDNIVGINCALKVGVIEVLVVRVGKLWLNGGQKDPIRCRGLDWMHWVLLWI